MSENLCYYQKKVIEETNPKSKKKTKYQKNDNLNIKDNEYTIEEMEIL